MGNWTVTCTVLIIPLCSAVDSFLTSEVHADYSLPVSPSRAQNAKELPVSYLRAGTPNMWLEPLPLQEESLPL